MNIVEKIGCGGISEVFKIEDNGRYFAFKTLKHVYKYNLVADSRIKKEYYILKKLNHKNIVKCYSWMIIEKRNGILMEFINGKQLKGEPVSRDWIGFDFIRSIISYLQNLNPAIIHNDISDMNILVDSFGQIKLLDFSSAFFLGEKQVMITKEARFSSYTNSNNILEIDAIALSNLINSLVKE